MSNKTLAQTTQTLGEGTGITVVNKSMSHKLRTGLNVSFVTALTIALLVIFLAPFLFMVRNKTERGHFYFAKNGDISISR